MDKPLNDFCGIPVVYHERYMGLARSVGIWPRKKIVVGVRFRLLPHDEKIATLLHEVNHCMMLHREIRWLLLPFCWTKWVERICKRQELDSDTYVVDNGFGAEMLAVIRRFYRQPIDEYYPTNEERAQNIMSQMQRRGYAVVA